MKPSIVSVSLVFLFAVGGAQAKDFLFMNFVGWYGELMLMLMLMLMLRVRRESYYTLVHTGS